MSKKIITIYRDAKNGRFVTKATTKRRPATTTTERRRVPCKNKKK